MDNGKLLVMQTLSLKGYLPISELSLFAENKQDFSMFYKKAMEIQGYRIEYLLDFSDLSLLDFPAVYLSEKTISYLSDIFLHIQEPITHLRKEKISYNSSCLYSVCYQLHNSNTIPRKNPERILEIIEQYLEDFFNKIINKDSYLAEYEHDFGGTIISLNNTNNNFEQWSLFLHGDKWGLWDICSVKQEKFFIEGKDFLVITVNEKSKPDFSDLVKNNSVIIDDFISFVRKWDFSAYQIFMQGLKESSSSKKFVFLWRNFILAGHFSWNRVSQKSLKHQENKGLMDTKISFVNAEILDFKKSILRNLPQKYSNGLLDRKVLLVGLGAIGGYMAEALTKLGAGVESDFVLVDNDFLEVNNIGRHLLGFQYCGQLKTTALVSYLQNQTFFQLNKLQGNPKNISSFSIDFFSKKNFDLIIDATGSIEVQEYLNEQIQKLLKDNRPILQNLWIFGNGECAQGFWSDPEKQEKEGGCIACLGTSSNGLYSQYLPINNLSPEQRIGVCSAFTPYAVSGGMLATSLGINMILEWLETSKVRKNYQTRYNSAYHQTKIDDLDITAHSSCPFCGGKTYDKTI